MQTLEQVLSEENVRSYEAVFNQVFGEMMNYVGYTRASLRVTDAAYAFTFYGDGRRITGHVKGVDQPEVLVEVNGRDLLAAVRLYEANLKEINAKPEEAVSRLASELPHFTVVFDKRSGYLWRFARLGLYFLRTYGFDWKVIASRPKMRFERLSAP